MFKGKTFQVEKSSEEKKPLFQGKTFQVTPSPSASQVQPTPGFQGRTFQITPKTKTPMLAEHWKQQGMRQGGWDDLEKSGKIKGLEKMETAGFAPPRPATIDWRDELKNVPFPTFGEIMKSIPKALTVTAKGTLKTLGKIALAINAKMDTGQPLMSSELRGQILPFLPKVESDTKEGRELWRKEMYEKLEPTAEEIPGAIASETIAFLLTYKAVSPNFASMSPAISKFLLKKFPAIETTRRGATALRLSSEVPKVVSSMATTGGIMEYADQLAKGDYDFNKVVGASLRSGKFGFIVGIGGSMPTMTLRLSTGFGLASAFSSAETLLKDGEIKVEDVPKIMQDAVLTTAIIWMNTRASTGIYKAHLQNARAKYIAEARFGKETSESLAKLDAYITTKGGVPQNQRVISLQGESPISDVQLAYSAKNKILAMQMKLDRDYLITTTDQAGVTKVLKAQPTQKTLSEFLTPQEKQFLEHMNNIAGNPSGFYAKYVEPNPIIRQINIKAPSIIKKIDIELGTSAKPIVKPAVDLTPLAQQPTQPLAQEAQKYKSAEEFVKSKPTLYHGTKEPNVIQNQNFNQVQQKAQEQGNLSLTPQEIETLNNGKKQVITPDGVEDITQEVIASQKVEELYAGVPLNKIAEIPITVQGSKRKLLDALGAEVVKYYGLTPEIKDALVKLAGGNELRKEELSKLFMELFPLQKDQAKLLTYHQENPEKYPITEDLKKHADQVADLMELSQSVQNSRPGLQKEFFPQSFINRAENEILQHKEIIPKLTQEKAINTHKKAIEDLQEYIKFLDGLSYVPHMYLQSEEIQRNILRLLPEGTLTATFRSGLTKLRGREIATLDDAKEMGLLPEEDIRVLLATHFEYLYRKVAIYDTIEDLKKNSTAVMPEDKAPKDWQKVAISQLNGYAVNPFLVDVIEDLSVNSKTSLIGKGYDAVNWVGKSLFFYNPIILPFWDIIQAYAAGSVSPWKPIYTSKLAIQSVKDVLGKGELYKEAVTRQLYGTPNVGHYAEPIEETMRFLVDKVDSQTPGWKKAVENILGEKINWKTFTPLTIYKQNWRITWGMDRIIRTMTLRDAMNKGMDIDTGVEYANNFHANYNLFTSKSKKWLNRAFLVPTYKTNMMVNLPGYVGKKTLGLAKGIATGKGGTPEQKAAFFSLWRLLLLGGGALAFAGWNGYRLREGYRLVKKLDEPEITPEGKVVTERVITLPGPFAEWFKAIGRAKQQGLSGIYMYLAKVPQIAWGLFRNARWNGDPYFEEAASKDVQRKQIITNLLKDYVAPYGQYDMMTREEQDAFGNIMGLFGMATYKRGGTEQRIMWQIRDRNEKLQKYLKKSTVSMEDKQKAVAEYEYYIQERIKELESYQKDFKK